MQVPLNRTHVVFDWSTVHVQTFHWSEVVELWILKGDLNKSRIVGLEEESHFSAAKPGSVINDQNRLLQLR